MGAFKSEEERKTRSGEAPRTDANHQRNAVVDPGERDATPTSIQQILAREKCRHNLKIRDVNAVKTNVKQQLQIRYCFENIYFTTFDKSLQPGAIFFDSKCIKSVWREPEPAPAGSIGLHGYDSQ